MPNWKEILQEIKDAGPQGGHDIVRRKYLRLLTEKTERHTIIYYSGWLQNKKSIEINDMDKNGFMACIHGLKDREQTGLDLILHTPGGRVDAAESIGYYLRKMFGTNIRVIVPHMAMSAGTMIACCAKEIIMGKHSNLGPTDPQINGYPTGMLLDLLEDLKKNPERAQVLSKITHPLPITIFLQSNLATKLAQEMVVKWLETGMFKDEFNASEKAKEIAEKLSSHTDHKMHNRHIHIDELPEGLKVTPLENDPDLQDLVLSLHHCCLQTLTDTPISKIIENQLGVAFMQI